MTTGGFGRACWDLARQLGGKIISDIANSTNNPDNNYNQLKQHRRDLQAMIDGHEIRATSKAKNQVLSSEYTEWKKKVSEIEQHLSSFCLNIDQKLPNLTIFEHSGLNTNIVQNDAKILKLIEEGRTINVVIDEPLKKLVTYLNDPNAKRIGVYGTGNDKTAMVLTQLRDHKVSKKFHKVIRVEASNDVQSVQQDIARQLNLKIQARGQSVQDDYAQKIREKLGSKKYLLMVNGVDYINLHAVGIIDDVNGKSKVVFSSESRETCDRYTANIVQV